MRKSAILLTRSTSSKRSLLRVAPAFIIYHLEESVPPLLLSTGKGQWPSSLCKHRERLILIARMKRSCPERSKAKKCCPFSYQNSTVAWTDASLTSIISISNYFSARQSAVSLPSFPAFTFRTATWAHTQKRSSRCSFHLAILRSSSSSTSPAY